MKNLFTLVLLFTLTACSGHDKNYIPYGINGFDVYVYVDSNEYYAGHITTSYLSADTDLSLAQNLADSYAREKGFIDYSYIVCTTTSNSSCATKVK